VRFHVVTVLPAETRELARARPMAPIPRMVTSVMRRTLRPHIDVRVKPTS
jgi:hypothetical protein